MNGREPELDPDEALDRLDARILAMTPTAARAALLVLARKHGGEVAGILDSLDELDGGES